MVQGFFFFFFLGCRGDGVEGQGRLGVVVVVGVRAVRGRGEGGWGGVGVLAEPGCVVFCSRLSQREKKAVVEIKHGRLA